MKTPGQTDGVTVRPLTTCEHGRWEALLSQSLEGTLFHSPLWLNALNVPYRIYGCFKGSDLRGGFAVTEGLKGIATHAQLTPYLGVVFPKPADRCVTTLGVNKEIASSLAVFLKTEFDYVHFRCPPEITDLQPFIWEGWRIGLRYTYRIGVSDLPVVLEKMDATRRRNLRSAEKEGLLIDQGDNFAQIIALSEKTFERQGLVAEFNQTAHNLNSTLQNVGRCRGFLARDTSGRALGGVWIVWDEKRAYYMVGGYDESSSSSNAVACAMWHAIRFTSIELKLREFDFEGSMIPAVERFFRKFGGELLPTYTVEWRRPTLAWRALKWARRVLSGQS